MAIGATTRTGRSRWAAVAHSIATSRRQLQRVFGEQGTSFREELQRVRMTRAAELLRDERCRSRLSRRRSAIARRRSSPRRSAVTTAAHPPPSARRPAGERPAAESALAA